MTFLGGAAFTLGGGGGNGGGVVFGPGGGEPVVGGVQPVLPDPFTNIPDASNPITRGIQQVGCAVSKFIGCANPISRPIWEELCGPCDTPQLDPFDPAGIDDFDRNIPQPRPQQPTNGCVPCGPNECRVQIGVNSCGQPRFRKGRLVVSPQTGAAVCVPKKPRMNPMNAKANRRSMSRLKGAHREAKKIIDTLDKFAKPRRSTAARSRTAAASCKCK